MFDNIVRPENRVEKTIDRANERIDYDEYGSGSTIVLVPGSCSTGAAWRPVMAAWEGRFRCVTTSLLGYGGTAERRTESDAGIAHEADMLESVICRAGGPVHVVGHSFGGLVAIAVALRRRVAMASLTIVEAPAVELLRAGGEDAHYQAFRRMSDSYFAAHRNGEKDAIASMVDFYGGAGTFASWPERVRAYAVETTPVNVLDWMSAYGFALSPALLAEIDVPCLVLLGTESHPAARRANELLGACIPGASTAVVPGAAHFMIATHARDVASLIGKHVADVQSRRGR